VFFILVKCEFEKKYLFMIAQNLSVYEQAIFLFDFYAWEKIQVFSGRINKENGYKQMYNFRFHAWKNLKKNYFCA